MTFSRGVAIALLAAVGLGVMPTPNAAARTVLLPDATARVVKRKPEAPAAAPAVGRRDIPLLSADPGRLRAVKASAARRVATGGGLSQGATSMLSPTPNAVLFGGLNSAGMSAGGTTTPPDTTGAIGPDNYLEFVNDVGITAYSRSSLSAVAGPVALGTFIGYPSDEVFDPQIQWDDNWGRWIYVMDDIEDSSHNYLAFGWSKTADPTDLSTEQPGEAAGAGWCSYFLATGSEFDDYPKLGHGNDGITIGTNVYNLAAEEFLTSRIWSVAKPANPATCPGFGEGGLTVAAFGSAGTPLLTEDGDEAFTPVPANTVDSSASSYVVAADYLADAQIMAWHVSGGGAGATLVPDGNMSVGSFSIPANVPQPGTTNVIDSNDGRLSNAVAVTDPAVGQEAVWTQHTIAGPDGPSVVRWYELLPGTHTVRQQGTVSDPDHFVFNGAISPTQQGDAAVIDFNRGSSTPTFFPEMHAQSRDASTPLNQMVHDVLLGTSSGAAVDFSCNLGGRPCRWGDYAGASPDPSVPGVVWGSSQGLAAPLAAPHDKDARWTTRNFAISADETPPDTTIDSGPSGLTNDSTPTFAFSSTEVGSSFECMVDGDGFGACSSPETLGPLGDGSHTFEMKAIDPAGNPDASPASRTFTVDTVPPNTTIDSGPSGLTNDSTPTFAFSSSEPGSSFECMVDGGGFSSCGSPFTASPLGDGPHGFQARAIDAAGNSDPTPASRSFSVETTPPPPPSANVECEKAKQAVAAARRTVKRSRKRVKSARTPAAKAKAKLKLKKARGKLKKALANEKRYC